MSRCSDTSLKGSLNIFILEIRVVSFLHLVRVFFCWQTFALAGLRIGWMCTRNNNLLKKMNGFKDYISMCSSSPSEILAIIALKNQEPILKRTMNIIQTNLPILDEFFKAHTDIFEWHKPRACSTGFVKVKGNL